MPCAAVRERIDTARGPAWLDEVGDGLIHVFENEDALQPLGMLVEHGREIGELHYSWSTGVGEGAPDGVEQTKVAAAAASSLTRARPPKQQSAAGSARLHDSESLRDEDDPLAQPMRISFLLTNSSAP